MKHKGYWLWPALALAVGGLSWLFSRKGMEETYPLLEKSALSPPGFVFPIVWTVLYILMGIGFAMVLNAKKPGSKAAGPIWFVQLGLNFLWSLLFFRWSLYGWALVCLILLWLAIAAMIGRFRAFSKTAAALQIPYLLWVTFAGWLNYVVWQLN